MVIIVRSALYAAIGYIAQSQRTAQHPAGYILSYLLSVLPDRLSQDIKASLIRACSAPCILSEASFLPNSLQ